MEAMGLLSFFLLSIQFHTLKFTFILAQNDLFSLLFSCAFPNYKKTPSLFFIILL